MKKTMIFGLVFVLLCVCFVSISFATNAPSSEPLAADGPLSYSDYFSSERAIKRYAYSENSAVYRSLEDVPAVDYEYRLENWEKFYAVQPEIDGLYYMPLNGGEYEYLVNLNGQSYDAELDTLYYVNAAGQIVSLDLVSRLERVIANAEGTVTAMEATCDLLFYEADRKLYRIYLPEGKTDLFMDLSLYNPRLKWSAFSNQCVRLFLHNRVIYYNRETDRYYSSLSSTDTFYITKGSENLVPPVISPKGTLFDTEGIFFNYSHLIRLIPDASYGSGTVTYETLKTAEFTNNNNDLLLQELSYAGIISMRTEDEMVYPNTETPYLPRIPAATVKECYEKIFGKGTFAALAGKDITDVVGGSLLYDAKSDEYRFLCYTGGGGDSGCLPRALYTDIATSEDEVVLQVRYGLVFRGSSSQIALYSGSSRLVDYQNAKAFSVIPEMDRPYEQTDSAVKRAQNGVYDSYFPLYKVTFKANGDGTYYWKSTELVEEATPVPEELFPVKNSVVNTETSSNTSSSATDAVSDSTSSVVEDIVFPTTDVPSEEGASSQGGISDDSDAGTDGSSDFVTDPSAEHSSDFVLGSDGDSGVSSWILGVVCLVVLCVGGTMTWLLLKKNATKK